ncbi:MAG TPA: hypothetical protein VFN67_40600 [Polyangiales bacterium]|nr:hypothetical protein [Polyangiales bacterium]
MLRLKIFFALLCLCACVLRCERVAAQGGDVVWVLGPESPLRAGFLSALRIELGDVYQVRASDLPMPGALPERIAAATELVESERAAATVWIEAGGSERVALLYVVGRRAGRALLEVVQAPDVRGMDLERMLSIKLAELLAQLRSDDAHPLNPVSKAASVAAPQLTAAAERPRPAAASSEARVWGAMLLGPRFQAGLGTGWSRFGLGATLAPELSFGSVRVALGLGIDLYPALDVRANSSEVSLNEVTPRVFAGLSWFTPGVSLSLQTGATWSFMSLHGRTPLGYEDSDSVSGLGGFLALCAERAFSSTLALGARAELHAAARRLSFDVNDVTVLDRGRLHLTLGIDLTFRTNIH